MSWEVRLLGELSASRGSEVVSRFRTQKTAALFAFLAFHANTAQPREVLIERFWPESDRDQGRMSLRTALSSLRKVFGDALVTDTSTAMLTAMTDHSRYERALRLARSERLTEAERVEHLGQAVELYGGALLPSLYDDWILAERDLLAAAQLAALSALARWHERLGETRHALDYAHRAAAADPFHEAVRADLIRLLIAAERPAEALRQFQELERLLAEQLGRQPAAETVALVAGLAVAETPQPATTVNLPSVRDRFRGRQELLVDLVQAVAGTRLVTLFGPGGIGKTRLAVESARRLSAGYGFGLVQFIPLAGARTVQQGWELLAEALGLPVGSATARVLDFLRASSPALLVLDNIEQLLPDGVALVEELLDTVLGLRLLTTSRHRLALPDEHLVAVEALPVRDSLALYTDRARIVVPRFALTEANEPTLRELMGVLEGFPLAIELAAAWAGTLAPTEQLVLLRASRLALPDDARKDPRHASLTAAIAWSCELLEPELKQAFQRLSVFQGGWEAGAAQQVCGVSRGALASLRDRALVRSESVGGTLRFSLHRSLQDFGSEALTDEQHDTLARRHRQFFLALAEEVPSPECLLRERENLLAAIESSPPEHLFAFGKALEEHWADSGALSDARAWRERVQQEASLPTEVLLTAGRLAFVENQAAEAQRLLEQALAQATEPGERARAHYVLSQVHHSLTSNFALARSHAEQVLALEPNHGPVLGILGLIARKQGQLDSAEAYLERALAQAEADQDTLRIAQTLNGLGPIYHLRASAGEDEAGKQAAVGRARACYERALALVAGVGQEALRLRVLINLGSLEGLVPNLDGAARCYTDAIALAQQMGDLRMLSYAQANLSIVYRFWGNQEEYLKLQRESLVIKYRLGIVQDVALAFMEIGQRLSPETTAQLFGAAARLRSQIGEQDAWMSYHEPAYRACREALGTRAYEQAFAKGQELTLDEAMALALGDQ